MAFKLPPRPQPDPSHKIVLKHPEPDTAHKIVVKHHEPAIHAPTKPSRKARDLRTTLILVHTCLIFLVAAITAGVFLKMKHNAVVRERQVAFARQTALNELAGHGERIARVGKQLDNLAREIEPWLIEGSNTVAAMPGGLPATPSETPSAKPSSAVSAPAAAAAPRAPPPSPPKPQPAKPIQADDPNRPYGMPSWEEVERRRREDAMPSPPPQPAPAAAEAQPVATPGIEPQSPPAATAAQSVLLALIRHAGAVRIKAEIASESLAESTRRNAEAQKQSFAEKIRPDVVAVRDLANTAEQSLTEARVERNGAEQRLKEIRELHAAFKERQKAEQDRREAQRRKEEREALIAQEKSRAAAVRETVRPLFPVFRYAQAVDMLTDALQEMKTPEGRQPLQTQLERYRMLVELKAFLISRMNQEVFTWGWGTAPKARDILGADEAGFRLRGAGAKWEDADVAQMQRLLDYYVLRPKVARDVWARQCLAAAVYLSEAGRAQESEKYRESALSTDRTLQDLAGRLFRGH